MQKNVMHVEKNLKMKKMIKLEIIVIIQENIEVLLVFLCNSKMKNPKFIPIYFHNLQNYDSHLFIKNIGATEGIISCIPKTEEKYIYF